MSTVLSTWFAGFVSHLGKVEIILINFKFMTRTLYFCFQLKISRRMNQSETLCIYYDLFLGQNGGGLLSLPGKCLHV